MLAAAGHKGLTWVRSVGRVLAVVVLAVFYAVGAVGGAVTVAVSTCAAAVRLGWTDTRKRGKHGPA